MHRPLRSHQRILAGIVAAIAAGQTNLADILAAVTPGGGKSLLPVIAAARLIEAGVVDRICWIVPRDSLRLQAEEAFADPAWRATLGHAVSVRAAANAPDLCRGLQGYVTTYQGIAAQPDLHLAEHRRHRYLLVVDEVHHLPSLAEVDPLAPDDEASWSRAILPLLETARIRLLLSGTLKRADGEAVPPQCRGIPLILYSAQAAPDRETFVFDQPTTGREPAPSASITAQSGAAPTSGNAALIALWLDGRPAATRRAYEADAAALLACLGGVPLGRATLTDLQAFAASLARLAPPAGPDGSLQSRACSAWGSGTPMPRTRWTAVRRCTLCRPPWAMPT